MTTEKGGKYRLGLDLGTNSIGWAAVNLDDRGNPCGVLGLGARIFPDGRDRHKTSNAVARRMARGQRRRRDRYLQRRAELMLALVEFGLMPKDEKERKEVQRLDPYRLRAQALDRPLEPFELGRALFHLDQRRGFRSNRKAGSGEEVEGKKISAAIDELRRSIQESGARTLGEFLARRHEERETVRAREGLGLYPDRSMYVAEFVSIQEAQRRHHALAEEQWERLREIIFFQRPLKPVDPGWCQFEFESREKRAAKALPVFQEFRMLQEVNNLRVQEGSKPERPLSQEERDRVLKRLRSGKDIKLREGRDDREVKPTRDRGLPPGAAFNLAHGGRRSIKGDETTARLSARGRFGDRWLSLPLEERNEIARFLLESEDPEAVRRKAVEEWGLNEASAEDVSGVSLAPGYGNLGDGLFAKILPHLRDGRMYSEAVQAAGYPYHSDFRNDEAHESLPYYGEVLPRDSVGADPTKDPGKDGEPARYGRIGNPTVHIGLNQLSRVVNRLIQVYGKPEEIAVELARDLKSSREQLRRYESEQREGGERNRRFAKMLEDAEQEPTPDLLRKLRLWEGQGPIHARVCPYTGRSLSFEVVVSNQTEVDHILPFSRTLDNSMANMVVCIAAANRAKGDRSPHEAFGHSPPGYNYEDLLTRTGGFPENKRWRFRPDAMSRFEEDDPFLDRQLNETGYLSRTARTYLAHLYDEKSEGQCVRAAPGRLTALLRRGWGLEGMLRVSDTGELTRKQRDDHRHHAIDAFVVANTTQGLLQRFALASASNRYDAEQRLGSLTPPPWEGFHRDQLRPFLDRLVVSYKPDHGTRGVNGKTTGQLHNDTAYGLVELSENGPSQVVTRKKLGEFNNRSGLDAVRDPAMRVALLELWDRVEAAIKTEGVRAAELPARFAERAATEGVPREGRLQTVRRVRVLDRQTVIPIQDRTGKSYKGYLPGRNEFADIWRLRDGTWQMVIVNAFHANQPGFDIEGFRPADKSGRKDPSATRLMRLQIDDMGALGNGQDRRIVRVRKMWTEKDGRTLVVLDEHNEANVDGRVRKKEMKVNKYSARQLQQRGFRKLGVDEIGRVLDPGPRKQ